ncbi:hypothetical protein Cni_G02168 [Canna indica]|uniref:Uncharacterized protein n=1 Tax=Canna indica TaxID=4628 RepID=A0AAQ3JRZ7_9LILI|nr:hypothetical protein Cni_G02168 [Canna indica]
MRGVTTLRRTLALLSLELQPVVDHRAVASRGGGADDEPALGGVDDAAALGSAKFGVVDGADADGVHADRPAASVGFTDSDGGVAAPADAPVDVSDPIEEDPSEDDPVEELPGEGEASASLVITVVSSLPGVSCGVVSSADGSPLPGFSSLMRSPALNPLSTSPSLRRLCPDLLAGVGLVPCSPESLVAPSPTPSAADDSDTAQICHLLQKALSSLKLVDQADPPSLGALPHGAGFPEFCVTRLPFAACLLRPRSPFEGFASLACFSSGGKKFLLLGKEVSDSPVLTSRAQVDQSINMLSSFEMDRHRLSEATWVEDQAWLLLGFGINLNPGPVCFNWVAHLDADPGFPKSPFGPALATTDSPSTGLLTSGKARCLGFGSRHPIGPILGTLSRSTTPGPNGLESAFTGQVLGSAGLQGPALTTWPILNEFTDFGGGLQPTSCPPHIPSFGVFYTWFDSQAIPTMAKLDRILVNSKLWDCIPNFRVIGEPRRLSDHAPLLLHQISPLTGESHPFRFELGWLNCKEFISIISACVLPALSPSVQNSDILKGWIHAWRALRPILRDWNSIRKKAWTSYIKYLDDLLHLMSTKADSGSLSSEELQNFRMLKQDLDGLYHSEDTYWRQRAKKRWLKEDD